MDINAARTLVDQTLAQAATRGTAPLVPVDVLPAIDRDGNGEASRDELVDAVAVQQLQVVDGAFVAARTESDQAPQSLTFDVAPAPPVVSPNERGLAGTPWFADQSVHAVPAQSLQGRQAIAADTMAIVNAMGETPDGLIGSSLSISETSAVGSQSFAEAAQSRLGPAEVALLWDQEFRYDYGRAGGGSGPGGARSATETQALGSGVCRDFAVWAREHLQAGGTPAVALGYTETGTNHAVLAYQDPQSGKWGIIEYGNVYPPEQVQGGSPEDALMRLRPSIMTISRYEDGSASDEGATHETRFYTPSARALSEFFAGPSRDAGTMVSGDNAQLELSTEHGEWRTSLQYRHGDQTPGLQGSVMAGVWRDFADGGFRLGVGGVIAPNMTRHTVGPNEVVRSSMAMGFVAAEEAHPEVVRLSDDNGWSLRLGSQTRIEGVVSSGDGNKVGMALTNLRWSPDAELSRTLDVDGDGTDEARVYASVGAGLDAGLLGRRLAWGGDSLPINTRGIAGAEIRPTSWLSATADVFVPFATHTNDQADSVTARFGISTPWLSASTTQSGDLGRYNLETGIDLGPLRAGAYGAIVDDRQNDQTDTRVGIQFGLR